VGYKDLAGGSRCAVLYTQAAGIRTLPWLKNPGSSPQGSASAVNNKGQVVGYSSVTNGNATHAFRYSPSSGKMEDLGVAVGYWNTSAWSINNKSVGNGDVVGVMSDGRSAYTGFLCTDKTGMIDLKTTIAGGWPSALRTLTVKKINDQGYIIGRIDNRACRLVPLK
jgi:probable HAF family extracellular repeat protein